MTREERAIKVLINVQSQFQASLDEVDVDEDCKEAEEDNTEIVNALEMAIKALKQEPRWIPVSERLPESAFGCLVTVYDTDLRTQDEFENVLPYFVGYDGETWNDDDGKPIPFEVIAWMPLPTPYKSESEDKE